MQFTEGFRGKVITSEWVLVEVACALASPPKRDRFLNLITLINASPNWTVIEASHNSYQRGLDLFSQRPDKTWSLTDCTSFVVMEELGLTEALTADHHFEQAGFVPLLA